MKEIINRFDRSYIINLRDRPDRKREVIAEFARAGIPLPHPKIEFYTAERPAEQGDFPSLGARGIFNSNRDVLRRAIADDLSNLLVFEDDVFFRDVPATEVAKVAAALDQEKWDIVYFGYIHPPDSALAGPLAQSDLLTIGGHFYGINGPFIRYMARYMDDCAARPPRHRLGGPTSRDGAFNHVRLIDPDIKVLLAVPNLAVQRYSPSDLSPSRIDSIPILAPVLKTWRRYRNSSKRRSV